MPTAIPFASETPHQDSFSDVPPIQSAELLESSAHFIHNLYQCPLHVWLAEGWQYQKKINSPPPKKLYWLYVEYRNASGCCCYSKFMFQNLTTAQQFIGGQLGQESLHAIDPAVTRANPVAANVML
jgi:hypothetical protein